MSASSCTPVVVDGWGGAGDGCVALASARDAVAAETDELRGAFPERWESTAADEFTARLAELLHHAAELCGLVESAQDLAAALAAAVAASRRTQ